MRGTHLLVPHQSLLRRCESWRGLGCACHHSPPGYDPSTCVAFNFMSAANVFSYNASAGSRISTYTFFADAVTGAPIECTNVPRGETAPILTEAVVIHCVGRVACCCRSRDRCGQRHGLLLCGV